MLGDEDWSDAGSFDFFSRASVILLDWMCKHEMAFQYEGNPTCMVAEWLHSKTPLDGVHGLLRIIISFETMWSFDSNS